jgi:hypothetical protein
MRIIVDILGKERLRALLRIFLKELGLERGPLSLVIG